jgi:protein O-GlcNAc transferase
MAALTLKEALTRTVELVQAGHMAEAQELAQRVLASNPNHWGVMLLLANIAHDRRNFPLAIGCALRALAINPTFAEAYNTLGMSYSATNHLEEAIAAHKKAVEFQPNNADFFAQLGGAYWRSCLMPQAYDAMRRAVELRPRDANIHNDLILTAVHVFPEDPRQIYEIHREWARKFTDPLEKDIRPHTNNPDPDRPLRIGYLSGQFRMHTGAFFLEPVLSAHDREHFKIYCYCTVDENPNDPITARFRTYADVWRNVEAINDEKLYEMIRNDEIDILVDVAGHTNGNRLLVFARKPAPVQVTYIGYQDTTGLKSIDYRFSDGYADPPGMTEEHFSEKIVRLPRTGYCFRAPDQTLDVSALPAKKNGYITFGSTNRVSKMTPETVKAWSRVMNQVPRSRLVIRSDGLTVPALQRNVQRQFAEYGIATDRLTLLGWSDFRDYQETFHQVDIVLDCFQFTGHTVTCQALWMGVPVVSLAGQTHTGRMGLSILSNLGMPELVTKDEDEFVAVAVGLANDVPRLEHLRATLRQQMQGSPLMDAETFSKEIAAAYREMWRTWCQTAAPVAVGAMATAGV